MLQVLGETTAARTAYEQARDIQQKLVEQYPAVPEYKNSLMPSQINLANLLADLGESTAARTAFEQARDIAQTLVKQFPAVPKYQNALANSNYYLANLLQSLGETTAARTSFEQSRDIWQKLVEQFPAVPEYQKGLAGSHTSVGILLSELGETTAARSSYEQARDIQQKLVEKFPAVPEYKNRLANIHNGLGNLLTNLGKLKEARAELAASLNIYKQLVDHLPNVPHYQINLGNGYNSYGELLKHEGLLDESLLWFDKAIQTLGAFYEKDPRQVKVKMLLVASLEGRSQVYYHLKRYDDAIKDLDQAVELNPPQAMALLRSDRARSRAQIDRTTESLAEAMEVAKADPKDSGEFQNLVLYNLACVYAITSGKIADKQQEYADRAMELLNSAVAAGYNKADSMAKDPDLDPLREREDFKQLLQSLHDKQPITNKAESQ